MGERRTDQVKRRRHTPEQIIRKLREADRMLGEGSEVPEVAKALEVSEQTYHRWRATYGGMKADEVKRLKELERENSQLKRIGRGEGEFALSPEAWSERLCGVSENCPQPRKDHCLRAGLASHVGLEHAEEAVGESGIAEHRRDLRREVVADIGAGVCNLVGDFLATVDQSDDVVEVGAGEKVALAAALEGLKLCGKQIRRRRGANARSRRQSALNGVRDARSLPLVGEAKDARVGRHSVEDQPSTMSPSADHPALLILGEVTSAELALEGLEARPGRDLDDHVDVLGRPNGRRSRIGDPQRHGRSADENDLLEQAVECGRGELEKLDAHATAGARASRRLRSLTARARTRASPMRIASISARRSPSSGSRPASAGTAGCSGASAIPR